MLRILIPLDGSTAAEESLTHAFAISEIFPAELVLLRVIEAEDMDANVRKDSIDLALWRRQAQAYLEGLLTKYSAQGQAIRYEVAEGHPAETIVQFINSLKPDLLVLTRYGRGNAQEFATGGTAQKVLSSATCSVMLLDPGRPVAHGQPYRHILVPVDDGKDSDCAVAVASMIAGIHKASVLLLHVTDAAHLPTDFPTTRKAQELVGQMNTLIRCEADRRLHELVAKTPSQIAVETRALTSSDPSLAIESTAEEHNSDLLLLHTSERDYDHGPRYDPVNQALILYSHRPLFILRSPSGEGLASNFRSVYLDEQRFEAS